MRATTWQFAHHRVVDGERCLIWGNGIGELLIPVNSPDYVEALNDRIWSPNALVDEGEVDILNVYFRATTAPTTFFGRLYTAAPGESATLSSISGTECAAANGYPGGGNPVQWTRGTTHFGAPSAGEPTTTLSQTRTFTATGTWTASLSHLILSDVGTTTTGKLLAWVALSTPRSLVASDTLDVSVSVGLS